MNVTIGQLIDELRQRNITTEFNGNRELTLYGFSDPGEYHEGTVIWLGDPDKFNREYAEPESVALLLYRTGSSAKFEAFPNRLGLEDPRNVFNGLVEEYFPIQYPEGLEPSAIVAESAKIGSHVYIGHHSVIGQNVRIGDHTVIQNNVSIHDNTVIGSHCFIGDSTAIGNAGFGFRMEGDHEMHRLPHLGGVEIGDRVEIGSNVTICRGTFKNTRLADGVKIDSNTYVGHNVFIDRNTLVINSQIDGNSSIGSASTIVNADVINRVHVGSHVFVGIGSVVVSDIPDNVRVFGVPARVVSGDSDPTETRYTIERNQLVQEELRRKMKIETVHPCGESIPQQNQDVPSLEQQAAAAVAAALDLPEGSINMDASAEEVEEWDSLAQLKIVVELENRFHVDIPIDQAVSLTSIPLIAQFLREHRR